MREATHYDITIGNIARDVHCDITMSNDVTRDIHCDVTMSHDIDMCTYHGISMHNNVAMNLFYYVLLCLFMLFYYRWYGIKSRTSLCLISLGWRTHPLFLCRATLHVR